MSTPSTAEREADQLAKRFNGAPDAKSVSRKFFLQLAEAFYARGANLSAEQAALNERILAACETRTKIRPDFSYGVESSFSLGPRVIAAPDVDPAQLFRQAAQDFAELTGLRVSMDPANDTPRSNALALVSVNLAAPDPIPNPFLVRKQENEAVRKLSEALSATQSSAGVVVVIDGLDRATPATLAAIENAAKDARATRHDRPVVFAASQSLEVALRQTRAPEGFADAAAHFSQSELSSVGSKKIIKEREQTKLDAQMDSEAPRALNLSSLDAKRKQRDVEAGPTKPGNQPRAPKL